jgi:hypothetical protein
MAGTGYAAFHAEQQITSRRDALRAFDTGSREAAASLEDVRAAQQAYVAAGQGVAFWMPKVASLVESAEQRVEELRTSAQTTEARSALLQAGSSVAEFKNADSRARDYVKSGQPLMAADVVFTEGGQTAAAAAQKVTAADVAEHLAFDAYEAGQKKAQLYAVGGGAAFTLLVLLVLTPGGASTRSTDQESAVSIAGAESAPVSEPAQAPPANAGSAPVSPSSDQAIPMLKAAAALCTEFGRVRDADGLKQLLARAAGALDAKGLVVWLGTADGADLRPLVAHGYPSQVLGRMPAIPKSADNAAAAAYRTGSMQLVVARAGESSGALVAPLLSADGCIGALTAEIAHGREQSESVQSLAVIFAAQLAGVLSASAQPDSSASARAASL